jgi:hypothetical protein
MQYIYPLIFPKLSPETHAEIKNAVFGTAAFTIRNIKQNFSEYIEQDHYRQSYHKNTNTLDNIGEYSNWLMTPELIGMIRNDLTDQLYPFSTVDFYFQYINNGHTVSAHRDSPRNMSFLYFIYENKGLTHFYKDLVNDPNRWLYDLNEIEGPIQTYQMKQYHWYAMRHDVIHNVTHIDRPRLAIVAEFSKDYHYEDWIAQHDNLLDKSFEKFEYHKFL